MITLRKRFTAFVIFQGAEHRRWWRIFTRRGWRHVYVVLPVYYPEPGLNAVAYSQIINFWTDHVRSDLVFHSPREVGKAALREGATCVISIPIDQKFTGRYVPRGLLTCVSLIKALLSIDAWWVWTPEQLAGWLLRNGGQLLEIDDNDSSVWRCPEDRQERTGGATARPTQAGSGDQQAVGG